MLFRSDRIVAQAAKDMERTQEKVMSVEYGIKGEAQGVDVVPAKEKGKEQEQAKTRRRGRGFSLGW